MWYNDQSLAEEYTLSPLKVYLLPGSIYRLFTKKYNLMEIHEYGKLRQLVSLRDIAMLNVLAKKFLVSASHSALKKVASSYNGAFSPLFENQAACSEVEFAEQQTTVKYLEEDPSFIQEVMNRYTYQEENTSTVCGSSVGVAPVPKEDPGYRIVILNNALYIIVEDDFLKKTTKTSQVRGFLTQFLKSAYSILKIQEVNTTAWYRQYLEVLAS